MVSNLGENYSLPLSLYWELIIKGRKTGPQTEERKGKRKLHEGGKREERQTNWVRKEE